MSIAKPFKEDYDFTYLEKVLRRGVTGGPIPIMELPVDPEIMSLATGIDYPFHRIPEVLEMGPEPDAGRFVDTLMGRAVGSTVPLVEYLVDETVRMPVVTELLGRDWVVAAERASQRAYLDNFVAFWLYMGYDFVRFEQSLGFEVRRILAPDTASSSTGQRAWMDEHQGEYVARRAQRLAWLTGFRGSAGLAIVLADRAAIFVDGRYTLAVRAQVDSNVFLPAHRPAFSSQKSRPRMTAATGSTTTQGLTLNSLGNVKSPKSPL